MRAFLPYGRQCIEDDDIKAVTGVLKSNFLTCGPIVDAFEKDFAEKVGARYAVSCSNGTAALHLAYMALGLEAGDSILVPTITFAATASAARMIGADPQFIDADPKNGLIVQDTWRYALSGANKETLRGITPVHMAGQSVDMEALFHDARAANLFIVEDACHALGSVYTDKSGQTHAVGSCKYSDATVFSLHPVKTIAAGEGGVVTTNDEALYEKLKLLRSHAMEKNKDKMEHEELAFDSAGQLNPWYYEVQNLGYNYRLPDINCALAQSQLKKLDRFKEARTALIAAYEKHLAPLSPYVQMIQKPENTNSCFHLAVALIDFSELDLERGNVMRALLAKGVGTQVHYIPVHLQPFYYSSYQTGHFSGALAYYSRALSLPLFVSMNEDDIAYVAACLKEALGL